jgi:hypothetical protein
MDKRLEKALDFSNYMITLENQKRILKEQYQNNIIFYFGGGQFTATQQLLSFCHSLVLLEQPSAVLIDDNDIPIEIENLDEFTDNVIGVYWKAANTYLIEYNKLRSNRTIEGIIGL